MMLNTRQKSIVYFLSKSGKCSKMNLAKIFFRISKDNRLGNDFHFYQFVPYKYGPYSFELFHDVELLERERAITTDSRNVSIKDAQAELPTPFTALLDEYSRLAHFDDKRLLNSVYSDYPEYTIFSKIKKKETYNRDRTGVIPLGYEGLSIDAFLMRLIREKVQTLVDVRDTPWSMKFGFKKNELSTFCDKLGIEYVGYPSLGVPNEYRKNLKTKNDYDALFRRYRRFITFKKDELKTLLEMSKNKRIALMCFEKDPECCHRTIIAEKLAEMGAEVG